MKEFTTQDAQRDFGRLLREAQDEPVRVTGEAEAVLVSPSRFEEYERLRREAAWSRLSATMERISDYAKQQGLTDEILDELLADES